MLRIHVNESSNTPRSKQVAQAIREAVFAGQLKAGDRLPSVRDGAEQWGVTKDSVHRAYKRLAEEGLIADSDDRGTLPLYQVSEEVTKPGEAERQRRLDGIVVAMIAQARKLGFQHAEILQTIERQTAKLKKPALGKGTNKAAK
ncbi:DNA-binding transcriptional regulator YhcF (GntR family) [Stenotrophomonas sp. PvP093]|uniref:GntR family transcriptional regulator n=1 Tax=unclassified Stenotrophomonas TaxID=196198 RepID=UPI001AEA1796|nr:GntR family transcriptional regulator [Stenotrophomonas sp. PvP093]MBP2480162.1 DNA-binding transcriptional regulator YhcF (GntR family) [Stenotrophomonas sp. PvP093]